MKNLDSTPPSNNSAPITNNTTSPIDADSWKALAHFRDLTQESLVNTTPAGSMVGLKSEELTKYCQMLSEYMVSESKRTTGKKLKNND